MLTRMWQTLAALAVVALVTAPLFAQAPAGESVDDLQEDLDLLNQMGTYQFTTDQFKAMLPILQGLDQKGKAAQAYAHSEEALAAVRAIREAALKGQPTDALEQAARPIYDKLDSLRQAYEEAIPGAMNQIAALLTDQQLAAFVSPNQTPANEAARVFDALTAQRGAQDQAFADWRDKEADSLAARVAPQGDPKVAEAGEKLKAFFDKVRKLSDDDLEAQSDALLTELEALMPPQKAAQSREDLQKRAADDLQYMMRSPRMVGLVEALVKARGQ